MLYPCHMLSNAMLSMTGNDGNDGNDSQCVNVDA